MPGTYYYRVITIGARRRTSAPSAAVPNATVAMSRTVGPAGGTLRAANGALTFAVPAGALETTETIGVSESATAPLAAGGLRSAGCYPCTECHDPHGSSNVYHLKETINGRTGLKVTSVRGDDSGNVEAWCGACHDFQPHRWWGTDCIGCHYHGRVTGRRF